MSYPPPPGVSAANSGPSHPSLPARPPPPKPSRFKPAFTAGAISPSTAAPGYTAPYAANNTPVSTPQQYGVSYPAPYGAMPPAMGTPSMSAPSYGAQSHAPSSYGPARPSQQQSYYGAQAAPPAIRNPFPAPGQDNNADYDPEMAAQIAQWQSTYSHPEAATTDGRSGKPGAFDPAAGFGAGIGAGMGAGMGPGIGAAIGAGIDAAISAVGPVTYGAPDPNAAATANLNEKKKTVVREGGGKKWSDDTLLEWDPSHFRLFVGNLAGETTDESLLKAFSRWTSVSKARVIRDKRTTKSKGFGFVSFSDADDFFQSAKEMNGKYIQSHPVIVRRSTTEIKSTNVKNGKGHHNKYKNKNKNKNKEDNFEPHLGPQPGNGIQKSGQKTKGGLKLLG